MKTIHVWSFLFCVFVSLAHSLASGVEFFPYKVEKKTLQNKMDIIVIETPEFKNVLSYNSLVLAGARNEIESGKTGLAHLFEHILFRHQWKGKLNGYDRLINEMGAFNNAWTNFDVTYYHPLTFTSNLKPKGERPSLPQLEAERFRNLDFTKGIFQTEAGAVLGEYRRIASDPGLLMRERLLALTFPNHSYGHTTMGYLKDVEDMPNEYQAAIDFYTNYYRPNNVVLIVLGDVKAREIFELAERLYGDWETARQAEIPETGPPGMSRREHITWDADVPPRLSYSYRMPPFRPSSVEGAVGQLLPELLAGETAPLFRLLRYEKKTASHLSLSSGNYESFDSRLLELSVTGFKDQYEQTGETYFTDVISDIERAFLDLRDFSQRPEAAQLLEELKRKFRYDLLSLLNSPSNIAEQFAWYYRFERDPQVFETLMNRVEALTVADFDTFAKKYFTKRTRVIITMAYEKKKDS